MTIPAAPGSFPQSLIWLVLALAAWLPIDAAAQGIQVTDAWSRPTAPEIEIGVAYFIIRNAGKDDLLVRASSPVAKSAA